MDLVIRNAHIYDGSGMPGYRGEIGIRDGRIARVGRAPQRGAREIDAGGLAAAPGFIDPHTHYDAQLCWDGQARPSLEHGVTTVVTGNCSLTLAPLREQQRDRLCRMFRQIEDLPMAAFEDGIDWTWESFGDYVRAIEPGLSINVAPLVGHSAIRMWVMGEEAFEREANETEIVEMQRILADCLAAGASGLSTSYVDVDDNWRPVPSRFAGHEEIRALSRTLGEVGHGVLQIVPEFYDTSLMLSRVDMLAEISLEFGVPTTLSPLFESTQTPELVGAVLARVQQWSELGARVWPQVQTRPIDINFTLRERNFMLLAMPTWFEVLNLPSKEAKIARYRDPETRARLIEEVAPSGASYLGNRVADAFVRGVALERNKPLLGRTLREIAAERGATPAEAMIDLALEEDLETEFKNGGLMHTDPEIVGEMLANDYVLIGASDAGAHVQAFATNGDTGYLFSKFVRETGALSLPAAIRKITHDTAAAWGLRDRGLLHPGYGADVVLFDPERIARDEEIGVRDLPGDGYRYIRKALGVEAVIVNGEVAYTAADGYTDSTSGELVTLQTPSAS